jgi:uncharacterized protein (DUF488 family)
MILTFGYGNLTTYDPLMVHLTAYPAAFILDTRRFPSSGRAIWNRSALQHQFPGRYQWDGVWLGNGRVRGERQEEVLVGQMWQLNVNDWRAACSDEPTLPLDRVIHHLREVKGWLDARERVPLFLCAERDAQTCHRADIALLARTQVWTDSDIIHLSHR